MNCLITRLKEAVTDSSLQRFGALVINVDKTSTNEDAYRLGLAYTEPTTIEIEGDGSFDNGQKTLRIGTTRTNFKYSVGVYSLIIPLNGLKRFTEGTAYFVNPMQWKGVDYHRIYLYSKDVLEAITIADDNAGVEEFLTCPNLSFISLQINSFFNANEIVEKMLQNGNVNSTIKVQIRKGVDAYGQIYDSLRNITVVSQSEYKVYSGSGTQLLYTAVYSEGKWSYTLA